jgi:hypothetical protein
MKMPNPALTFLILCIFSLIGNSRTAAAGALKCSPETIGKGQILRIQLGRAHPSELAIMRPDGGFFFLAQKSLGVNVHAIPSEIFIGMTSLELEVDSLMAHRWEIDSVGYERVFTDKGRYKLILGETLESDLEPYLSCEIDYKP